MNPGIRTTAGLLIGLATLVVSRAAPAFADNSYFAVAINTLADSSDPNSDIVFTSILEMSEADRDGNVVAWQINNAYFTQHISGVSKRNWKADSIGVDTSDGLWWVQHADPDAPVQAEFDLPPELTGEAAVYQSSAPEPLVFLLKGRTGAHGYSLLRYDYSFRLLNEEDPEEEDIDDIGEFEDDPVSLQAGYLLDAGANILQLASDDPDSDFYIAGLGLSIVLANGWMPYADVSYWGGYEDLDRVRLQVGLRREL